MLLDRRTRRLAAGSRRYLDGSLWPAEDGPASLLEPARRPRMNPLMDFLWTAIAWLGVVALLLMAFELSKRGLIR